MYLKILGLTHSFWNLLACLELIRKKWPVQVKYFPTLGWRQLFREEHTQGLCELSKAVSQLDLKEPHWGKYQPPLKVTEEQRPTHRPCAPLLLHNFETRERHRAKPLLSGAQVPLTDKHAIFHMNRRKASSGTSTKQEQKQGLAEVSSDSSPHTGRPHHRTTLSFLAWHRRKEMRYPSNCSETTDYRMIKKWTGQFPG